MKVVIRMSAGLANRMFQYSYYLYLKKNGINAFVDNNYKATKWKMEEISWNNIFKNAPISQPNKAIIYLMGGGYDLLSKIRRHLNLLSCVKLLSPFDIIEYDEIVKSQYIIGVFQNAKIIEENIEEIYKAFSFADFSDSLNIAVSKEIKSCNSVAIHVRKGKDYISRPDYKGTCDLDYYLRAIEFINNSVQDPKFYVFTDNQEWVKNNFIGFEYKLINHNPAIGWGNHYDMQLMSLCKHNIIANSTYSWWSAFLNKNSSKIVIMPVNWFNSEIHKTNLSTGLLCKNWIQL